MSKLIAVISPAKLLDDRTRYPELACTLPEFLADADFLASKLRKLSGKQLSKLMDISAALGEENHRRYQSWHLPLTHDNAHPAIMMFRGDVYRGLQANELDKSDLNYAEKHLRILSGMFGILRPLDLVLPHRLMMGTPFQATAKHKNLYQYWGEKPTLSLREQLDEKGTLVNLASQEYFKVVDIKTLNRKVITCEFKEKKGSKLTIVSTYAKLARGKMARFLIDNRIQKPSDIKAFDTDHYKYEPGLSSETDMVFVRG